MSEKMLAIHFLGEGKISLDEMLKPHAKGKNVVVKIKAAGICGTDRHPLMESGQKTVPGHENAGEVVEVDKPSWARVGDRVALNCHVTCHACEHCLRGDLYFCDHLEVLGYGWDGGFAEYILVPEDNCTPLPDDISMENGALMVDVLGTAYQGVKRANLLPGSKVAIWGGGPIGFEVAAVAAFLGASVAVLDMNPYRLEMAGKYNHPDLALDPTAADTEGRIMDWTAGRGLDVAFECVGNEKAAHQAMRVLKKRGTLSIIGVSHNLSVNPWDMIQRELSITTSRNFNTHEFNEMVALIRNGLWADKVITHRFHFNEAEAAIQEYLNGQSGKIVFVN